MVTRSRPKAHSGAQRRVRVGSHPSVSSTCALLFLHAACCSTHSPPPEDTRITGRCEDGSSFPSDSKDSARVFDEDHLATYRLVLPAAKWNTLQDQALDEEYVRAQLDVDACYLGEVGLRFKGAVGSLEMCFDEHGKLTCDKLSMKIKFNKYDKDKRYYGLKRLNFHALTHDKSLMHNRLAYGIFREMGIVTSRATHAKLVVNGEYRGVFSLVEQIDGRFTANRFPEGGDGNLYKGVWPDTDSPGHFDWGLKTNNDNPDHSQIIALYTEISSAAQSELAEVVTRWLDAEYVMRFMAVDDAIHNFDGVTAFWCGDWGCGNGNYYLYQDEFAPKFSLLAWDLDGTFAAESPFSHVPSWDMPPRDCDKLYRVFDNSGSLMAANCDPLLHGFGLVRRSTPHYDDAVQELLSGPFSLDGLNEKLTRWSDQIREAVTDDPYGPGHADWARAVLDLRDNLEILHAKLSDRRTSFRPRVDP
ncbi:MAG: CotH kinase family protein [Nannocystaceae bacterium]